MYSYRHTPVMLLLVMDAFVLSWDTVPGCMYKSACLSVRTLLVLSIIICV